MPPTQTPELKALQDRLLERAREVPQDLWKPDPIGGIRCVSCGHRCLIYEGRDGICKVRSNRGGKLVVPWGYVGALQVDPIEKKPFFHVRPGSDALSFGMLGCDLHCAYCQNWFTSQTLRDKNSTARPMDITAEDLVEMAIRHGARTVASTYNEPLITSEWAVHVFKQAKARGLETAYISNGNGTPEVLAYLRPYVDYYKIDLKSFSDKHYRQLGGVLENILRTIRDVYRLGFFLEIVTLVIPGFNDGAEEMKRLAEFLVSVSPDIPWHVTAFHDDYKMREPGGTPVETLVRTAEIGREAGLRYIYIGNVPGQAGEWENTYCPGCRLELVQRWGYHIRKNLMTGPSCPRCQTQIPGIWT